MSFLGPASIGAGLDFIGGMLGRSDANKARKTALGAESQFRREDRQFQTHWNQRQEAFAREQFEKAIRTRVADANAAGLHPLFALGAAGASSPTFVAGQAPTGSYVGAGQQTARHWSAGLGDIARAVGRDISAKEARSLAADQVAQDKLIAGLQADEMRARIGLLNAQREDIMSEAHGKRLEQSALYGPRVAPLPEAAPLEWRRTYPKAEHEPMRVAPARIAVKGSDGEIVMVDDPEIFEDVWQRAQYYGTLGHRRFREFNDKVFRNAREAWGRIKKRWSR